jgi:hypothetical protein
MKSAQPRSTAVTCLIRPPTVSSLTVVRCLACSSVRPRAVQAQEVPVLSQRRQQVGALAVGGGWPPWALTARSSVLVVMVWSFRGLQAGSRSRSKLTLRAIAATF